jgi:hypothetical protein
LKRHFQARITAFNFLFDTSIFNYIQEMLKVLAFGFVQNSIMPTFRRCKQGVANFMAC